MFQLNNLKPARGAKRRPKRVGRGNGSRHGTYSTRGLNGQRSRSGGTPHGWFEGGQMPLYRRVPKRGFYSRNRIENQIVNLSDFERFEASREIDLVYLRELGIVSGPDPRVKILGQGELNGTFRVKVHAVSKSAREKIEAKGGSVELVPHGTVRSTPAKPSKGKKKSAPVEESKAEAPAAEAPAAPVDQPRGEEEEKGA